MFDLFILGKNFYLLKQDGIDAPKNILIKQQRSSMVRGCDEECYARAECAMYFEDKENCFLNGDIFGVTLNKNPIVTSGFLIHCHNNRK